VGIPLCARHCTTGRSCKAVPMDGQGMRSDSLRAILAGWNVERDGPRLRVIYTVAVGQNPSGLTMGLERKKAIYDVCVEYDIIIAEDVPYFFLRVRAKKSYSTFLRIDTQGRVIRMDTFSKTIAPGNAARLVYM